MQKLLSRSRMITVTDDWYPCYPGNQVELSICLMHFTKCESWNEHYVVKISAWGMDDTGVEIYEETDDYHTAVRTYAKYLRLYESIPDGKDRHWFIENGFEIA